MREFGFVADRLEDIGRELGVSSYTGFLQESNRKVKHLLEQDTFYVDHFSHSAAGSQVHQWTKDLLDTAPPGYTLLLKDENSPAIRYFEQPMSAIALVAFDETCNNAAPLKEKIDFFKEQYRLIVLVNFTGEDIAKTFARDLGFAVRHMIIPSADVAGKNVEALLRTIITDPLVFTKCRKLAYINSLRPLFPVLDEVFLSENKAMQTRKLLYTQNAQILRKDEQTLNQMDLVNNLRQTITKYGQETDKNLKAKYEELNKPNTGQFSRMAQEQTNQLRDFKTDKMAEKPEKLAITIDDQFKDNFLKRISANLRVSFDKDEQFAKAGLEDLVSRINITLQQKNIAPIRTQDIESPLSNKRGIITSYCYLSRQFTGEIIKKGPYEYFIALRDYIGVIMVATGLLAPLNMIASLGDDKESFFHFLKDMNRYIKLSTALIAIILIVYGIYDLRKRIPRKREEEFNREMLKARELLLSETRRMCNEASRDWSSNLLAWVREVSQNLNNALDKNVKGQQMQKLQQMNQEKTSQQRQQQSVDLIQRNIQSAERVKDQLSTRFRDLTAETEKDLKF